MAKPAGDCASPRRSARPGRSAPPCSPAAGDRRRSPPGRRSWPAPPSPASGSSRRAWRRPATPSTRWSHSAGDAPPPRLRPCEWTPAEATAQGWAVAFSLASGAGGDPEALEDGFRGRLRRGRVLTGDQVAVDDDVGTPGRATDEVGAGVTQARLQQPRRVRGKPRLRLLFVGEGGQLAAGEEPAVGIAGGEEAGRPVADRGDGLVGVRERGGEDA